MTKRALIIAFIITLLLGACSFFGGKEAPAQPSMSNTDEQTALPAQGEQIAVMTTNKGVIKIKFFPQYAPETVKNFMELSKKGFYNGLTFHRIIPDFMIQGGDPIGDGTGGETYKGPGTALPDEFSPKLTHIRGALSMANRGPNTGTSQFFIVQNKTGTHYLNGRHAVFGQVFEGISVADAIANTPRDANDKPKSPIKIETITIENVK